MVNIYNNQDRDLIKNFSIFRWNIKTWNIKCCHSFQGPQNCMGELSRVCLSFLWTQRFDSVCVWIFSKNILLSTSHSLQIYALLHVVIWDVCLLRNSCVTGHVVILYHEGTKHRHVKLKRQTHVVSEQEGTVSCTGRANPRIVLVIVHTVREHTQAHTCTHTLSFCVTSSSSFV